MDPERWRKIEALYEAAVNAEPSQRATVLEERCGGDEALRSEVESLLLHDEKVGDFLRVPPREKPLEVGQHVSHYQVQEKLGQGGMGAVYRAYDSTLRRPVALKVLPPEYAADPERRRRMLREARAASALSHPNVVAIYEVGSDNGVDFIAMEFVEGKTLAALIPAKGLPLGKALDYAVQIAGGLTKAHAEAMIHRDLKPANIMVTGDGLVKVLDFGLARRVTLESGPDTALTVEGEIAGTPAYMSPEQAEGKPLDTRSDVFSFGVVLYEMLSGRRAFSGDSTAGVLTAVLRGEPTPLGEKVPQSLEKVVTRCLRKDPARRFQHMDDAKVELEELKEESESGALAPGAQARRPTFRGGKRTVGIAALAGALIAVSWLWFSRSRPASPESPMTAVPLTSFPGLELSPTFSPEGNQVAFCWNGEKQDNFDIYVQMISSGRPLRLTTDPASDFSPAWSPDGRQIAFLRDLGSNRLAVILIPPLGGPERRLAELRPALRDLAGDVTLAWHPGGKQLAVTDAGALFLLSIETGEKWRLTTPPNARIHLNPAFSPDGRRLVFCQWSNYVGELHILSLDAGLAPRGEPVRLTAAMQNAAFPVWTADGREIIFSAGPFLNPSLWRIAVSGPGEPQRLASLGEGATQPVLTRDGRHLAYSRVAHDTDIWRIELSRRQNGTARRTRLIAASGYEYRPQFSPNGSKIAFESTRSGTPEVWVCDRDGSNAVQVTSFGGPLTGSPQWSPDGQQIVFDSRPYGHTDIFVVGASGGKPRRLTTNPAQNLIPSWSRDGKWIYFESNRTGTSQLWKMRAQESSAPEEPIQVTRNGGSGPAYESYDGKLVYYPRAGAGVWQVPVEGVEETQVLTSIQSRWSWFAVVDKGLYFIPRGEAVVRLLDFSTRAIRTVATLDQSRTGVDLAVSPDGQTILYSQRSRRDGDLMFVENFR